jgi:hypothetical protein
LRLNKDDSTRYDKLSISCGEQAAAFLRYHVVTAPEHNILVQLQLPCASQWITTFQQQYHIHVMANTPVLTLPQQVLLAKMIKNWLFMLVSCWGQDLLR